MGKVWLLGSVLGAWRKALELAVQDGARPPLFLRICLLLMAASAALFFALPVTSHDTRINLILVVVLLVLGVFAGKLRWFVPVLYAALLSGAALVIFIGMQTGGIYSLVLLWLCVVPLAALLLAGPLHGLVWLLLVQAMLLAIWWASGAGWAEPFLQDGFVGSSVALISALLAVITSFGVVAVYDKLHRSRLALLEEGNQALQKMHVDLVQAQTHKDEFVAAVGHELRTPMSAILGLNAVLREQLAHQPEQVEAVDHIRRSARQLLSVVNNILDFSQLQAGQLHLRPDWMDVRQVLTEVQDECRNRASFKGLDVRLSSDPSVPELVHLDRQRFKQLVANLLDNALRYSPDGGVIAVTAVCHAQRLRVDVSDTGAGIDPTEQAHIFEVFPSGSERRENAAQGTGLGLSICQQLVALHGGRIGVVSDKGAGARFWFELPLQSQTPQPADPSACASSLSLALDVLVVDDDLVNRMVTELQLRKALPQCRVVSLPDALQAQRHLLTVPCDVVVLDMYMPGMSGLDLARWMRQQSGPVAEVTVIGLTASTYPQDWDRCLQAGMDGVLTKPLDVARIVQTVASLARRKPEALT